MDLGKCGNVSEGYEFTAREKSLPQKFRKVNNLTYE